VVIVQGLLVGREPPVQSAESRRLREVRTRQINGIGGERLVDVERSPEPLLPELHGAGAAHVVVCVERVERRRRAGLVLVVLLEVAALEERDRTGRGRGVARRTAARTDAVRRAPDRRGGGGDRQEDEVA